jgi:hypothetical protein
MDNDNTGMDWRKSTYSNGQGNCVEVADARGVILVRDTKDRGGETLAFGTDAWAAFLAAMQ